MSRPFLLAVAAALAAAAPAQARLFWQTYGATVAAPDGAGCVWNLNQDYFVPRYCDSCRYGLFSACKTSHTLSAACRNLHPIYHGYCSPYGACRYCWRDHVYKTYCGCTPHRCYRGPWEVDRCKHCCLALKHGCHGGACCSTYPAPGGSLCESNCLGLDDAQYAEPPCHEGCWSLCNVEPFGGETLGDIAAISTGAATAGGPSAAASQRVGTGVVSVPVGGAQPSLPAPTPIAPTSGSGIPYLPF